VCTAIKDKEIEMHQIKMSFVALLIAATPALATMEMATQAGMSPPSTTTAKTLKGKVLETVTSGGYTYILLQLPKESKWVAIPETYITTGETVEVLQGSEMGELYSKTLKRTFPSIQFSSGLAVERPRESPEVTTKKLAAHASVGLDTAKEKGEDLLAANIKIDKATGDNAYTIEGINTNKSNLNGKRVTVRGKIVKASKGILKTNWYHLRDGSGDAAKKTNNLVVTGRTELLLGDTVTATGTIATDKDFGGGYFYEVIMEGTTFSP
jgi:hypothetical protein